MSSSSDLRSHDVRRGRVLRGGVAVVERPSHVPAELERDLDAVSESVRAWNPERVAAALADGYREGHDQGLDDGYAEGIARGLAQAEALEAQRRQHAETALAALAAAVTDLRARHVAAVAALEEDVVNLVVGLTEAVLARELRATDSAALEALQRGLALAAPDGPATARLHPDDVAALLPAGTDAAAATWVDPGTGRSVRLVGDTTVGLGGCIVDAGDASVDAQLGPALERARAALLGLDADEITA